MSFRTFDDNGEVVRKRVTLDCQKAVEDGEKVMVEQSHKDMVDINNIVKRHGVDMIAKVAALQEWRYDDVTGNDFQESMNAILRAKDTFNSVPSEIRKQFDNDPAKFMDFVHNPDNQEELVNMGLANPPAPEPEPVAVVVTNPPETPPEPTP